MSKFSVLTLCLIYTNKAMCHDDVPPALVTNVSHNCHSIEFIHFNSFLNVSHTVSIYSNQVTFRQSQTMLVTNVRHSQNNLLNLGRFELKTVEKLWLTTYPT